MTEEIEGIKPKPFNADKLRMQIQHAKAAQELVIQEQIASEDSLSALADYGAEFNPLAMGKNFKEINNRAQPELQELTEDIPENADPAEVQKQAEKFQKQNPELSPRSLLIIKSSIYPTDSKEAILTKIRNSYPDPSLADEVLDFLIQTTSDTNPLKATLKQTKKEFNEASGREIRAGKNILTESREFSKAGLGSPTALRDLYREITGNPREPTALFEELNQSFAFPDMKKVIDFVLHSIGADMKSKGPSIEPAELQRLFSEARTLQAILGVYRFFSSRMALVKGEFGRSGLSLPSTIDFQTLSRVFMKLLQERYPSIERVLQLAALLGISEELLAKIILFTQYRDALRHVSPKLFKSEKHRQDLLSTLLDALVDLEDELEEDDEDEEDDDDNNQKRK